MASGNNRGVEYMRPEVATMLPTYERINDCLIGAPALKGWIPAEPWYPVAPLAGTDAATGALRYFGMDRRKRYLPMPNANDKSEENRERYHSYVTRAVWYNVPSRTQSGLVGQLFLRDPDAEIPDTLDSIKEDADGTGTSLMQFAKHAAGDLISHGRGALFVDYPKQSDIDAIATTKDESGKPVASKQDLEDNNIRPFIHWVKPWNIVNWRTREVNGNHVLAFVVIREWMAADPLTEDITSENYFDLFQYWQYRVYGLDQNDDAYVQVWSNYNDQANKAEGKFEVESTTYPTDSDGNKFNGKLPFMFVGAEKNTHLMQKAPMDDLVEIALGHYRNSADNEELIFQLGQPTVAITGMTKEWLTDVLGGSVFFGSRQVIPLQANSDIKMIQFQPNTLVSQGLKDKQEQMVALGAKLVMTQHTSRTATETVINTTSEQSTLANIADNLSDGLEWALGWCQSFMDNSAVTDPSNKDNVDSEGNGIEYRLNKEFDMNALGSDELSFAVKAWESGATAFSEMRTPLKRAGYATLDDKDAQDEIKKELEAMPQPVVIMPGGADPTATGAPLGGRAQQTQELNDTSGATGANNGQSGSATGSGASTK